MFDCRIEQTDVVKAKTMIEVDKTMTYCNMQMTIFCHRSDLLDWSTCIEKKTMHSLGLRCRYTFPAWFSTSELSLMKCFESNPAKKCSGNSTAEL